MSSNGRSARSPETRVHTPPKRQKPWSALRKLRAAPQRRTIPNNLFHLLVLICVTVATGGCAKGVRPYSAQQAMQALQTQAAQVQTSRGRAWVSVKTRTPEGKEEKSSFPAIIVVDRTNPLMPSMRIEFIDLVGATHSLMLLEKGGRFTWIDYDARRIYDVRGALWGLPLRQLPDLVLGLAPVLDDARVGGVNADGFSVRTKNRVYEYLMTWIDPGPRLALAEVEGQVFGPMRSRVKSSGSGGTETYVVRFSKFADKDDFYLPIEADLKGYVESRPEPHIEMTIAWRERKWNETVPPQVFSVPKAGLEGFARERL